MGNLPGDEILVLSKLYVPLRTVHVPVEERISLHSRRLFGHMSREGPRIRLVFGPRGERGPLLHCAGRQAGEQGLPLAWFAAGEQPATAPRE